MTIPKLYHRISNFYVFSKFIIIYKNIMPTVESQCNYCIILTLKSVNVQCTNIIYIYIYYIKMIEGQTTPGH